MNEERHTPIEEMEVYTRYEEVADWAWDVVKKWAPLAIDTMGKQLIRAADSIGANLVEGDGRYSKADGLHFFFIARASARETRYWIRRATKRGLITPSESERQITALASATRMLNRLIAYRRSLPPMGLLKEDALIYTSSSNDLNVYLENSNAQHPTPNTQHPIPSSRIVIATTNVKKGGEMEQILTAALPNLTFVRLSEFPDMPDVEETGETFMENAHLKALATAKHTGQMTIADDGGLVIDALDGNPGVKSHRFLGEQTSFEEKMTRILEMMQDVPEERRTCRFECAVVIATPEGETWECRGICEGRVAHEMRGTHGFGYDPIFFLPQFGKQMAELLPEEKHKISHRGKALACAIERIQILLP